jgi:putative RecB family exonuclease
MDITELRQEPHLSASALNTYIDCGLCYRFGAIDELLPEFRSDSLEFGSCIHKTLESYYRNKLEGKKLLAKELHEIFEREWRERTEGKDDIRYSEGKDFQILLFEGKELLQVYLSKIQHDDQFQVIGVEEPFRFTIPGCPVPIIGLIDLIETDDSGTLIITDFKTSNRAYSLEETAKNLQLTLYKMAVKENGYSQHQILLKLDCLIKTKVPKFEQVYSTRDLVDERKALKVITETWKGINRGVFVPNYSSWKCKNCHYANACESEAMK